MKHQKKLQNISHYNPLIFIFRSWNGQNSFIKCYWLKIKPKNKVMFISAERFMYHFVKSIKSNEMIKFKDYFRNTDVLLIDDIQFMNGKEALARRIFSYI